MDLKPFLKIAKKFASDNTAGLLTGIGAAGTVITAFSTGRAAFRTGMDASTQYHDAYHEKVLNGNQDIPEEVVELLSTKHIVKTYWKEFIPPAILGTMSVTAIIAANRVGARRHAAVVAAFKLSEELGREYREKVVETFGKEREDKMNASLAKERAERTPYQTIILSGSETLFFDSFSGRSFKANMEDVKRAVNEINYRVNNYGWASLSDFYDEIGVGKTEISDEFGWKQDYLLEPHFTAVKLAGDIPALQIEFNKTEIRSFNRFG